MKKFVKKTVTKLVAFVILCGAFGTVASAYGVTAASFNYYSSSSSSTPIYEAAKNTTVYAKGSVTYDATAYGWIPVPSSCYFYLETPSGALNKPSAVSGSWSSATFSYVSYSDISENAVYQMYKSFSIASKVTKTASATVSTKSVTTNYYNGCAGSGSGHDSDNNSLCSFKTK